MVTRHRHLLGAVALVSTVAACDCGDTKTRQVGKMELTIDSPADNATFQTGETIDFHASAADQLGIKLMELRAGGADGVPDTLLQTCTPEAGFPPQMTCDFPLDINQHGELIGSGRITLTAVAFERNGVKFKESVVVHAKPIVVRFVKPDLVPNSDPPVARVYGTSQIRVEVVATLPLQTVGVTDERGNVVAQWRNNPMSPVSQNIIWAETPGIGQHRLLANASDSAGNVDSDTRDILVACTQDSDCRGEPNTRCCQDDGLCHQMVGANQICDCAHPCPLDQGCFPGTCGETPQRCRPGCYPGGPPDATHPYGIAADRCPRQTDLVDPSISKPAYCSRLPASQVTAANKGGACAVGDDCDVALQNCPDLPIDRTQPPGPNNPPVPQTCQPVAPGVNACMPSGNIAAWGINCDQVCGETANNCQKGYECVSLADSSGRRIGPSTCRKQCSNPGRDPSTDCPSNRSACNKVYVAGMVYLSTGVCQEDPCFTNSDCRQFPATPCCNSYNVCDVCR